MVAGIEDYSAAIVVPQMMRERELQGGHPIQKNGKVLKYVGGFCVVFPYEITSRKFAVRCWHTPMESVQKHLKTIEERVKRFDLPYFVDYKYYEDALLTAKGLQSIAVMDWVEAKPIKKYIADNLYRPAVLESLAHTFLIMTEELHEQGISHGDLQHGNILVRPDGSIVLVDYDSLYVIGMDEVPDDIKGLQGYQHPARIYQHFRSTYSDFFSELVIYTSIQTLARYPWLWDKSNIANTETMLFTEKDIQSGGSSEIFRLIESDGDIRYLGCAVKDALRQPSLDKIVPLQEIVKGQTETVAESLSKQWQTHTYQANPFQSNIDIFNQLAEIASRW